MSRLKKLLSALPLLLACALIPARIAQAQPVPLPALSQPALSPDGSRIVFVAGGDLWTVPAGGGTAHLLVSDPATESRPLFSPDGKRLAFVSTRTGNGDIYVLTLATGELTRLTWDDDPEQLDGWSRDGRWIYFSSSSHDIGSMSDVYRVHPEGGTPLEVSADRYVSEFFSAPAPDGRTIALAAHGIASQQWWRHGRSHIDESEIWLLRDGVYSRLTTGGFKDLWPMWSPDRSPDGGKLFFSSDRSGAENLWTVDVAAPQALPKMITHFTDGRLLWPTLSYDGRTLLFERDFGIWSLDTASGTAAAVPIQLEGAPAGPGFEHKTFSSDFDQAALSPDGKKVAFLSHGDVFAVSAKDGGLAARVTDTPGPEGQLTWAPDSRRLVYTSDRNGHSHLVLYDFATSRETVLTKGSSEDDTPRFSPDGKLLAFERDRKGLWILDLASHQERKLVDALLDGPPLGSERPFDWSPDGRWIAYLSYGDRLFRDIRVVPVAGGAPRAVSFLANLNGDDLSWSPDGKFLLYVTGQRTENSQIARIDLQPRTPRFPEDEFKSLFETEKPVEGAEEKDKDIKDAKDSKDSEDKKDGKKKDEPKKVPPVEIAFEGIRQRTSLLPLGLEVSGQLISPDGKWVVLTASVAGQSNLYAYSLDELAKEPPVARQLTSTTGEKGSLTFSPDSKEVYFLDGGSIHAVALEAGAKPRGVPAHAEMDVDFAQEKLAVFDQVWTGLRDNFVDPGMHGVDWQAFRGIYGARAAAARTADDLRRVFNLMIGELNASHSGVRLPQSAIARSTGHLGLRFDRAEYESSGRLRIREVLPLGPAGVTGKVHAGDWLLAVDGHPIDAGTNLDRLLDQRIRRQVILTVAAAPGEPAKSHREVAVKPVDQRTEKNLIYRRWVEENREYVAKASGGRLGYVHMFDMSSASLSQLFVDLDAENHARDGVVIDVRNNSGGFVNAYALDILSRRPYLSMTFRGLPTAPARVILGQRALERPTILLTNRHTLSDGEDFSEGYRTLGLGKIVGEPTAGWIIYTSDVNLIDGSQLRVPFIKITDHAGQDMEMHPRPVDIEVTRPIGEGLAGKDSQLDAAVRELLQEIK
ncbi:MAG TPA: DPP IV N-terminal domain-containing protein [Thermoanaerobaculia bacterium]|jgi:Tol biopolymer transport system component|nr:DPP IV N-terminal domain-containing protein [Thermoanaerobaculia bacterium]